MEKGLFNISSATTTELIAKNSLGGSIKAIYIANCNATYAVTIKLFLTDGTNETSYVENLSIPVGCTLLLNENINFNNTNLALKITTTGPSPDVNVIIK